SSFHLSYQAPPPPELYTLSLHDALPISCFGRIAYLIPVTKLRIGHSAGVMDSGSVFIRFDYWSYQPIGVLSNCYLFSERWIAGSTAPLQAVSFGALFIYE